jgi:4,5-DOPA dioxygenase extradiol
VTDSKVAPAAVAMPVWFVAHGSPMLAIEDVPITRMFRGLAGRTPRPRALVVVSAHWQTRGEVRVTSAARPETIHDFGGFDPALYSISYPAPGDPELAGRVVTMLLAAGITTRPDPTRGLDHGAWVPLRHIYPDADVPVVQVSLPFSASPRELWRIGQALAPLRHEGVLLIGSGGMVHNLGTVEMADEDAATPAWARELDLWFAARLGERDHARLLDYRGQAPHATLGVPTTEHLDPLFVALGAALPADALDTLFEGFQHGTLSLRSIALKPA